jgi:hypothetical protein
MESRGYERSSEIAGWRGTLTDIAVLAGRIGEMLGGSEAASVVITEDGGRRHEFSSPNRLRAVADTIDAGSVGSIEILGKRRVVAGETGAYDLVSVRASRVNRRWRSGGLELLVTVPADKEADRMHSELERAVRQRVVARRLRWIGLAAGRPSISLAGERRSRRTRMGRIVEAAVDVGFEALGTAIVALVVLVILHLL